MDIHASNWLFFFLINLSIVTICRSTIVLHINTLNNIIRGNSHSGVGPSGLLLCIPNSGRVYKSF